MVCSLLAWLALGCGDNGDGNGASNGAAAAGGGTGASGGSGASGQGGSTGTGATGGSAGSREQTPPPEMPRELGPPDGIYCESDFNRPPVQTCPAGSRCCPYGERDTDPCVLDGGMCHACEYVTCGQLLCDGPEDCSAGQFCCYARKGFCKNNEDCTNRENSSWMSVDCRARCVGDQRDVDHGIVVCKDDRDCPGPYVEGRCQPLNLGELPHGLSVCSGP